MADTEHYGSLGALAPAWDEGERNIDMYWLAEPASGSEMARQYGG